MANPQVTSLSEASPAFFQQLNQDQQEAFAGSQQALDSISQAWQPILQGGAVPFGYTEQLDNLLQSQDINQGNAAITNSENAAALKEQQASGGANVAPTGAQAQINAAISDEGQSAINQALSGTQEAGYQQGLENLEGGTNAELGIASEENPAGLANAATNALNAGVNAGNTEWKENQAGSFMNVLGGITGDVSNVANAAAKFASL